MADDVMEITAMIPWYGSKRTLALRIAAELGPHSAYWELFAGSMAVLLTKAPCAMETVNDMHGEMVNLARCVQDSVVGAKLYRRLRRMMACRVFMDEAAARWKEHAKGSVAPGVPDIDRAADFFASSWLGRNGVSGTQSYNQGFSRRYTKSGGHAATRWARAVDSIPAWRRRMRSVLVDSMCGIEMASKVRDEKGVAVYADPPYWKKGAAYVHDFRREFDAAELAAVKALYPELAGDERIERYGDHGLLAAVLTRKTKARVVVSYYDEPEVREMYDVPGWTVVECPQTKGLVNQGARDKAGVNKGIGEVAPEILLVNGASFTGGWESGGGGGGGDGGLWK